MISSKPFQPRTPSPTPLQTFIGALPRVMSRAMPGALRLGPVLATLLVLVCAGCALRTAPPQVELPPAEAWSLFRARQEALTAAPDDISLKATLYYTAEGRSNRTILELWGDREYPLRMNISAGVGTTLALMREDADGLVVYYPSENKAYVHPDSRAAMAALGLDLPFNLRDLAALLAGPATRLLPNEYASVRDAGGLFSYTLPPESTTGEVRLHPDGRLAGLAGHGDQPWHIDIASHKRVLAGRAYVPERLTMDVPGRQRATLRLRSLDFRATPWLPKALELEIPPQAETIVAPPAYGTAHEARTPD